MPIPDAISCEARSVDIHRMNSQALSLCADLADTPKPSTKRLPFHGPNWRLVGSITMSQANLSPMVFSNVGMSNVPVRAMANLPVSNPPPIAFAALSSGDTPCLAIMSANSCTECLNPSFPTAFIFRFGMS